jgi:hypothetical protein
MKIQNSLLAVGTLALWMFSGFAAADDRSTFPGAMCQPSQSYDQVQRDSLGGLLNTDIGSNQRWICPMLRASVVAPKGIVGAEIEVIRANSTRGAACRLCSRGSSGVDFQCSNFMLAPRTSTSPQPLQFGGLPGFLTATPPSRTPFGYYYFECLIPPREADKDGNPDPSGEPSGIVSYYWRETS